MRKNFNKSKISQSSNHKISPEHTKKQLENWIPNAGRNIVRSIEDLRETNNESYIFYDPARAEVDSDLQLRC